MQHLFSQANYILAPAYKCYENGGFIDTTDSSRLLGSRSYHRLPVKALIGYKMPLAQWIKIGFSCSATEL